MSASMNWTAWCWNRRVLTNNKHYLPHISNLLSESLPFQRILGRLVQTSPRQSDGSRSDLRASEVECGHRHFESVARLTDHVLLRHTDIIEIDGARVRSPLSQVVLLLSSAESGRVAVDDERREGLRSWGLRVGIGSGKHIEPFGVSSTRDPHLRSVQHILVAILLALHPHSTHIGSRTGLRDSERSDHWLRGQHAQILLLLFLVAGYQKRSNRERRTEDGQLDSSASVGERLDHKTRV